MKLYEINDAILNCIDGETGEIIDADALETLQIERNEKIESIALWIKNLSADAAAYKTEKEAFAAREKAAQAKIDSLKRYLTNALDGQKFTTQKCAVSFRKSEKVEIVDMAKIPKNYITTEITEKPDKNAIKAAIKSGEAVDGCVIVENQNITIK